MIFESKRTITKRSRLSNFTTTFLYIFSNLKWISFHFYFIENLIICRYLREQKFGAVVGRTNIKYVHKYIRLCVESSVVLLRCIEMFYQNTCSFT